MQKTVKREDKFYMNADYSIGRNKHGESVESHTHDFIEIVYIVSGKGINFINGKEYPMSCGDLFFINYNCTHAMTTTAGFEYVNILIKPEYISEGLKGNESAFSLLTCSDFAEFEKTVNKDNCFVHFHSYERKKMETIIDILESENQGACQGKELVMRSLFNVLLTFIFRKMSLPMKNTFGINEELLEYIRDNCNTKLTLEFLASRSYYNPSYFSRVFKEYTGLTLTEYITDCRIKLAKKLLAETNYPIERIIIETGFSNRTYFFKAFADKTGQSPLQYRKSKN